MPVYEYKVVPAPSKGQKGKGVKGAAGRFANALETVMNTHGAEGWEYLRADTLPSEERSGLTGSTTVYQNMLVFRREKAVVAAQPEQPAALAPPTAPVAQIAPPKAPAKPQADTPAEAPAEAPAGGTTDAAAAAVAAALSAYRDSGEKSSAPRLGPAKGDDVAAE